MKRHVFVCVQNRPAGHPLGSCQSKASPSVYRAFSDALARSALSDEVRLTLTGCLGPCAKGPNVLVYPDGIFYGGVTQLDVTTIVEQHLIEGKPVGRLAVQDW